MELKEFTVEKKDKWNEFVAENPYGNVLQTWEWGQVKSSPQWEPLYLGVYHKKQLILTALILKRNLPFHLALYYSPYGPVTDWEMPYASEALELIKDYLKQDNRFLFWQIEPKITDTQAQSFKIINLLQDLQFVPAIKATQPQHTSVVKLDKDEKDLLASFEKDTRYSIRRAEREGVEVKEFQNPLNNQPIREFYDLYATTAIRGQFPARPLTQFNRAWEEFAPDKMRCFQSWYQEKLLAAALVFITGKKAYLIYAGSIREDQYKNLFPTYILQWEIMKSLQKLGVREYDMWGIIPKEAKNHPWQGISLFKRGFKGEEQNYIGAFDLPLSHFYSIFRLIGKLRYKR